MPDSEFQDPAPPSRDGLPDEIRRNFIPVAAATDTPAPGDGGKLPLVNLAQPISALARTVGMILHAAPVFRFGDGGLATVDEQGRISGMNPERFTSWVEDHLAFTRPAKDAPAVESIGKDLAGKILAADQFRDQLRELNSVSEVRLPVWVEAGDGKRTVELAPAGYDARTGCFTVDSVPYAEDMPPGEAWGLLEELLGQFPYDPEGEAVVKFRRSFSVQMAAMLGVYCRELLPEGTPRPMIIWNANQPGAGKSLLMRVVLAAVYGPPSESGKPETESEFEKVLDSAAIARKPYLVLDDCRSIHSQALNRFVTSPVHECRLMHSQRMATIPKVTQVFATGNSLTISPDLERRALVVDLFEPGEAAARRFANEITPGWLFSKETRARVLAALWVIIRHWREKGMPVNAEHRRASFEEWSGLIGGIAAAAKLRNPFAPRLAETGGDEAGRALQIVIGELVGGADTADKRVLTTAEIIDHADGRGLTEIIVGFAKDSRKALGHRMRKLKGRHLVDSQGRKFEFGRRDLAAGASYPITFL